MTATYMEMMVDEFAVQLCKAAMYSWTEGGGGGGEGGGPSMVLLFRIDEFVITLESPSS